MSKTVYKAPFVTIESEEVRLINADQLFEEKVGQLPEVVEDDGPIAKYGFDPYGDGDSFQTEEDPSVSALFDSGAPDLSGMPEGGFEMPPMREEFAEGEQDGFQGLNPEQVERATMGEGVPSRMIEEAQKEVEALLADAHLQAQNLLDETSRQAQQLAEQIKQDAYEQGSAQGYEDGQARAKEEWKAEKNKLEQTRQELLDEYDEKLRMMEPALVEQLTGIYEHIFTVELSGYRSVIEHLITNTMHALDASGSYLIHVSPDDYSALSMQKASLRSECGIPDGAVMELVEDISLSKNQCLIETDDGIFDCSLSVQLKELKRKLMLLAYDGTRK